MVRTYQQVTDEQRRELLNHVRMGQSIKNAAELVGMNYENAKAVTRIFRKEDRTDAKKFRMRAKKGEDHDALMARKQLAQNATTDAPMEVEPKPSTSSISKMVKVIEKQPLIRSAGQSLGPTKKSC
jgi:hypothetical protein